MKLCIWSRAHPSTFQDASNKRRDKNGRFTNHWPPYELREGPLRIHLTRQEGLIALCLFGNRLVTKDLLVDVLWPQDRAEDYTPEFFHKCMDTQVCKLRRKFRMFGWDITTRKWVGWSLVEPFREERLAA